MKNRTTLSGQQIDPATYWRRMVDSYTAIRNPVYARGVAAICYEREAAGADVSVWEACALIRGEDYQAPTGVLGNWGRR